ncbi:pyrroline-5-carboxylate reductase [Clostridium vitabionis]|uniref:pyrroline-5-carboxylate reductase n=1 Tax=Clostridium vitabionis TaxID=2784388 RepID=UPI00188B4CCD|nr:pyrroline-5-carboxylate reductase [Clostridium vitabionis]
MYEIGIIGVGSIGSAILKSILKLYRKDQLTFTNRSVRKIEKLQAETGVQPSSSNQELAENSKIIVLAVKPQVYDKVLGEIRGHVTDDKIIIVMAAGTTIQSVTDRLDGHKRVVRCMPNTPALIGEGMTGVSYDRNLFTETEKQTISNIFESFGMMEFLPEDLMNAVTCISGSSPAYIYMFIEALADAAVKYGMPRDIAYRMAAKSVEGSAKMVLLSGKHPGELKDNVCSPGGTTIAAVAVLEEYGMRNAVIKASDACYEKCLELAHKKEG